MFEHVASTLPDNGRFYLQTMVFGPNMIPVEEARASTHRATPTRGTSR